MKASDQDLGSVAEACRVDSRIAFEANERIRIELLALRKVADAAAKYKAATAGPLSHNVFFELDDALKEAGR
jgi:hypothetical protein